MGHRHGDSDILYKAISFEDRLIGQIYDSVKEREAKYGEDWLFVVTTDHGRTANNGKGHGGQSDRERSTWIAINKPDINAYAKQSCSGYRYITNHDRFSKSESTCRNTKGN